MNRDNFGFGEDDMDLDIKFDDDHDNTNAIINIKVDQNHKGAMETQVNGTNQNHNDNLHPIHNPAIEDHNHHQLDSNQLKSTDKTTIPHKSTSNSIPTNQNVLNENLIVNKKKLKTNPFATKDKKVKKLEDIKIDNNGIINTPEANGN